MQQSSTIFAYLAVAFVIYITMRGQLRAYWGFLVGTGAPTSSPSPVAGKTASNNVTLDDAAKLIAKGAELAAAL